MFPNFAAASASLALSLIHCCLSFFAVLLHFFVFSTGKLAQIINEMKIYHLQILGISEMRWTGSGRLVSEEITVLHSGGDKHEKGVALLFDKMTEKAIISWEPVSERIITARLRTRFTNVTIIQVYAPTEAACDTDKDGFYEQLSQVMNTAPTYDLKIHCVSKKRAPFLFLS